MNYLDDMDKRKILSGFRQGKIEESCYRGKDILSRLVLL